MLIGRHQVRDFGKEKRIVPQIPGDFPLETLWVNTDVVSYLDRYSMSKQQPDGYHPM